MCCRLDGADPDHGKGDGLVTHTQQVLQLLSDGQPHSHHEMYELRVMAHSRVADLRRIGYTVECWREDGMYWYRLLDDGRLANGAGESPLPVAPIIEQSDGQLVLA